ncbi:MAG: WbqC family protein [Candidatus Pacebacteria bacterium]|nr:WbqC family protein [Candidatus Paceibacterota bacterium]
MILTAHQPVYLPWLGLFHKIAISDSFCYFDDVQYQIKDYNNRNKIKTANGDIWLTVPVLNKGYRDKKIREIEINNTIDWRKKHWGSICVNYRKAPFFEKYAQFLEETYKKEWKYLSDLNEYMLKWFLDQLGIKVKYSKASEMKFEGQKSGLVLDMCKKLGADIYIFGAMGKDYAKEEDFAKSGVNIYFQDYKHPVYPQAFGQFSPYMSIIDLLFNCGDKSLEVLMSGNITKEELLKKYGSK